MVVKNRNLLINWMTYSASLVHAKWKVWPWHSVLSVFSSGPVSVNVCNLWDDNLVMFSQRCCSSPFSGYQPLITKRKCSSICELAFNFTNEYSNCWIISFKWIKESSPQIHKVPTDMFQLLIYIKHFFRLGYIFIWMIFLWPDYASSIRRRNNTSFLLQIKSLIHRK